jgi:hypothetical protein
VGSRRHTQLVGSKSASSGWAGYAVQMAVNGGSKQLIFGVLHRREGI